MILAPNGNKLFNTSIVLFQNFQGVKIILTISIKQNNLLFARQKVWLLTFLKYAKYAGQNQ